MNSQRPADIYVFKPEIVDDIQRQLREGVPREVIIQRLAAKLPANREQIESLVPQAEEITAALKPPEPPPDFDSPASKFSDPQLVQFVLDELGSKFDGDAIILAVCERTGANWASAEYFVRQVAFKNRAGVIAHWNRVIIPFGIIFTGIGLILFVTGGLSLVEWFGIKARVVPLTPPLDLYACAFGLLMMIGGATGIYFALHSPAYKQAP